MSSKLLRLAAVALLALAAVPAAWGVKFAVLSDPHLFAPSLVRGNSAAYKDYCDGNQRLVAESEAILSAMCDTLVNDLKPDFVLITGDLTNNGERASHELMAKYLGRLKQAGIACYVIPGNHDCNNPLAVSYDGEGTSPAPNVSRKDFQKIYKDYGYDAGSQRDKHSLSYSCRPASGITLLAIDSNRDEENSRGSGDKATVYVNGGKVKAATLEWAAQQARLAAERGDVVIAMMHHHADSHFDGEATLASNYVASNGDAVHDTLIACGVPVLFTGHFHVNDAMLSLRQGIDTARTITEVATSAAVCYPISLRMCEVNENDIVITTHRMHTGLQAMAKQHLEHGVKGMLRQVATKAAQQLMQRLGGQSDGNAVLSNLTKSGGAIDEMAAAMEQPATQAYVAFAEGNERLERTQPIIDSLSAAINEAVLGAIPLNGVPFIKQLITPVVEKAKEKVMPIIMSMLTDTNRYGTPAASVTDDLRLIIPLKK